MLLNKIAPFVLILAVGVSTGFTQSTPPQAQSAQQPSAQQEPSVPVEEIIRRFSEKEKQFKIARAA